MNNDDRSTKGFSPGLTWRLRRLARPIAFALLVALTPLASGCYGRFPVTHAVYRWNGEVTDNRLVHSLLMWLLIIVPVYHFAMLGDVFIFNLIEFWTGDTLHISYETEKDGAKVAFNTSEDGNEAVLSVTKDGKTLAEQHFVRVSDTTFEVRDAKGIVTGMVIKDVQGGFQLTDAKGATISSISPETVAASRPF